MHVHRKEKILKNMKMVQGHFPPDHHPVLIHVTKKRPLEDLELAYSLGVRDFGENRVDELREKSEHFTSRGVSDIRWHFIGQIQTNKINRLLKIPGLYALHSIGSLKHLKALIEREEHLLSEQVHFFVQVNTSDEDEKSGVVSYDDLGAMANYYLSLASSDSGRFHWQGLMTMGKLRTDDFENDARVCFSKLASFRDQLQSDYPLEDLKLSMGMSGDYKMALQEGTDYLRLGGLLYDE